ncbi:hypothetical protein Tco_0208579 [Tanacetum coccineum]
MWKNVENIPSFIPRPAYVPVGSRNRPTFVPAGWHNPAARPMTRPKSHYFQQFSRPGSYNQINMDGERWGTAVKTSVGCSWQSNKPYMHWGSKNNGGSQQSTGLRGTVTFGGGDGKITGKGTIRTSNFHFENVYYVKELQN